MGKFGAALAAAALMTVAACGGSSGGRPSVGDISEALTKGDSALIPSSVKLSDDAATCIAEALHDSGISDEALDALISGEEDYEPSKKDEDAIEPMMSKFVECATSGLDLGDITGN